MARVRLVIFVRDVDSPRGVGRVEAVAVRVLRKLDGQVMDRRTDPALQGQYRGSAERRGEHGVVLPGPDDLNGAGAVVLEPEARLSRVHTGAQEHAIGVGRLLGLVERLLEAVDIRSTAARLDAVVGGARDGGNGKGNRCRRGDGQQGAREIVHGPKTRLSAHGRPEGPADDHASVFRQTPSKRERARLGRLLTAWDSVGRVWPVRGLLVALGAIVSAVALAQPSGAGTERHPAFRAASGQRFVTPNAQFGSRSGSESTAASSWSQRIARAQGGRRSGSPSRLFALGRRRHDRIRSCSSLAGPRSTRSTPPSRRSWQDFLLPGTATSSCTTSAASASRARGSVVPSSTSFVPPRSPETFVHGDGWRRSAPAGDGWSGADVKLDAYTAAQDAADLDALRRALLGAGSWNVYALSAGALIGLTAIAFGPRGSAA